MRKERPWPIRPTYEPNPPEHETWFLRLPATFDRDVRRGSRSVRYCSQAPLRRKMWRLRAWSYRPTLSSYQQCNLRRALKCAVSHDDRWLFGVSEVLRPTKKVRLQCSWEGCYGKNGVKSFATKITKNRKTAHTNHARKTVIRNSEKKTRSTGSGLENNQMCKHVFLSDGVWLCDVVL